MPPKKFIKSNKFRWARNRDSTDEHQTSPKKASLAIEGLPILDYPSSNNHEVILRAEKLFTSYVEKIYPYNGKIFKEGERFKFDEIEEPEEMWTQRNDPNGIHRRMLQKKVDRLVESIEDEKSNRIKVYSIIWNQLTTAFQQKAQEDEDFEQIESQRDDLRLWTLVQSICLGTEDRSVNKIKLKHQAKKKYESIRQYKGESVYMFKERFIAALTRLEALEIELPLEEEQAIVFVEGLDDVKYSSWKMEIANNQLRGINIYPKSLNDAAMQASNFKIVTTKSQEEQPTVFITNAQDFKKRKDTIAPKKDMTKVKCYNCQKLGHYAYKCPKKQDRENAINEVKEEKKATVNIAFAGSSIDEDCLNSMGFLTALMTRENNPNIVYFDNCAQASIFFNSELLENIRPSKQMRISGVGGNYINCDKTGYFKGIKVYFNENASGNVLCQYDVMQKYTTSWIEEQSAWKVEFDDKDILFKPIKKMWGHEFNQEKKVMISSVEENKSHFSKLEIQRANEAKELMKKLGYPSVPDMKKMVSNGSIINCPTTVKDIDRAEIIYGKDIASLKGKTTSKKSAKVELSDINYDAIKQLKNNIVLSTDNFFIRGLKFIITVNNQFKLITVKYLGDSKTSTILTAITSIVKLYASRDFKIDTIIMDGEQGLQSNQLDINNLGIQVNVTGKGKHASQAERMIRLIKERVRAYANSLPYKLPDIILVWLVYAVVYNLNNTPRTSNPYGLSPRILFDGRKINFKRDLKSSFGDYVQVHESDEIKNTLKPRSKDAIFLKMRGNLQGTAEFLDLSTWKIIGRDNWTNIPIPNSVIDIINAKAKSEGSYSKQFEEEDYCEQVINDVDEIDIDEELLPRLIDNHDSESNNEATYSIDQLDVDDNDNENYTVDEVNNNELDTAEGEIPESIQVDELNNDNDICESEGTTKESIMTEENITGPRYPRRDRVSTNSFYEAGGFAMNYMTNMTISEATSEHGKQAYLGIYKEVKQMIDKTVFKPVKTDKKKLPCKLFLTLKSDSVKGRLVAGGHRQDRSLYSEEDTYAATVATQHLFCIASIAGAENRFVVTIDIVGAYLNANMKREDIYLHIKPDLASYFFDLKPEWKKNANDDGSLDVQALKAIYGCIESAHLFTEHATNNLRKIGFVTNPYDPCIMNKVSDRGNQITIAMHSDDWKLTCINEQDIDDVINLIQEVYHDIKVKRGNEHNYLGMKFIYGNGEVKIIMTEYISSIVEWWGTTQTAKTPASDDLFVIGDTNILTNEMSSKFHSGVAKCLYVAKRARPDILTAVSYLTTRVQSPNESDYKKLDRLFKYLNGTKELGLRLTQKNGINVMIQIDASFAVHPEAKSHAGSATSIGEGTIYAKSSKIKMNTKSSTESEFIACSDHAPMGINMMNFLVKQGYKINQVIIGQDNQSSIHLINRGRPASLRTRHINIRYFFLKDLIDRGEVLIKYIPTNDMIADILTKPLQGHQFLALRKKLLNEA